MQRARKNQIYGALAGAAVSIGLSLLLAVTSAAAPPSLSTAATDATIGQAIHVTAQLSESPNASGEISFEVFGPNDPTCSEPALTPTPASASVTGEGEYSSGDFDAPEAGVYRWSAHYTGDDENEPADSICSAVSTVSKASPGLDGAATSAVAVGSPIDDSVTISGGFQPGGQIVFRAFGPGDGTCATAASYEEGVSVNGNGVYSPAGFSPVTAGEYRWTATYSGDANNEAVGLGCNAADQSSTVSQASPSLEGTATSATVVGSAIDDSVTISGGFQPGGQIVFRAFGPGDGTCATTPQYEEAVTVSGNGTYSPLGFSPASTGSYRWTAAYSSDANNEAISLGCGAANQTSTVGQASPGLGGAATANVVVGSVITDSVAISGGFQPGGQILFRAFGPGDGTCANGAAYEETVAVSGNGTYSPIGFSPASAGLYRWTAAYSGDANNDPSALACNAANQSSTVSKASPSLEGVATSAVVVGAPIGDSVTISAGFQPGGQLVFRAFGPGDGTCVTTPKYEETVAVNGNGVYSPAGFSPPPGLYRWTAAYSGDANNQAIGLGCNAANQSSTVSKASPSLEGVATSVLAVGSAIDDSVTISGGFQPGGQLLFRAFGPADETCATTPKYEEAVTVGGNGTYSPAGFSPATAGLYRWTATYSGDANNEPIALGCGAQNQASAVGKVAVILAASAASGTVGNPVTATASIRNGAIPGGQITFRAFPPGDATCSGPAAFSSTVNVSGLGSYLSAAFVPTRVGAFRWTVAYSGDPNHNPAAAGCGEATSSISQTRPSIASGVEGRLMVGKSFWVTANLQGGFAPGGTISFQIYDPSAVGCAKPLAVNTVAVNGNGTVRSDPFVPLRPGRYSFLARYSGDASNQGAAESCDPSGHAALVDKRTPKVKPHARLKGKNRISIRAKLSGAISPNGVVNFRLYRPGDTRCKGKPVFTGGVNVKSNGTYLLAEYLASKKGIYRLSVGYSGDNRNRRYTPSCRGAQSISVS
jgi:hypothetical protein